MPSPTHTLHSALRTWGVVFVIALSTRYASAEPPTQAAAPAAQPSTPLAAYLMGAIGMSGISVAGVTGFLALNQKGIAEDHCSSTLQLCDAAGKAANDTGRTLRDISSFAWIVGGLGLGISAYLLLTAPSQRSEIGLSVVVDGSTPKAALVAHF